MGHDPNPHRDEALNSLTHAVGLALAICGLILLVVLAVLRGSALHVVSYSIYGVTLVALYAASTAYHGVRRPHVKRRLKVVDHAAIYLLIAGTYTPFTLLSLRGAWGWSLFGVIWGLAAAGVVFKLFFTGRFERTSTAIYLAMGWLVVIAAGPMIARVPLAAIALLFAGGLCYSFGVLFYMTDHRWRFGHAVWHLFVLSGSTCHFFAILLFTLPRR